MRVLITGAAGFVGHHLVEHLLKNTDWNITILDRLTYASNGLCRLRDIGCFEQHKARVEFLPLDISTPIAVGMEKEIGQVDYILHLAAETHVDNSIADPRPFVMSNVVGTMEMLQFARRQNGRLKAFLYFSTDEIFGPAPQNHNYKEWDRYNSTNPYSATKAAAEELCLAWANTYKLPMIITHCMNAYGERQHPEKFIPMTVKKILRGEIIPIHSDPSRTKAGSRFYIHCRSIASGVLFLLQHMPVDMNGFIRDKFNIVGETEVDNLALVKLIHSDLCEIFGKELELKYEMVDFHSSRPGHDLRYSLSGEKLRKLGWTPPLTFETSLHKCVQWMVEPANLHWLML